MLVAAVEGVGAGGEGLALLAAVGGGTCLCFVWGGVRSVGGGGRRSRLRGNKVTRTPNTHAHTSTPSAHAKHARAPVFLPYTTLDVIVSTLSVGTLLRYVVCCDSLLENCCASQVAMESTRSSSLPYLGKEPSIWLGGRLGSVGSRLGVGWESVGSRLGVAWGVGWSLWG